MISESGVRPAALVALMRDQYGNYVVQRALEVASQAQRAALLAAIKVRDSGRSWPVSGRASRAIRGPAHDALASVCHAADCLCMLDVSLACTIMAGCAAAMCRKWPPWVILHFASPSTPLLLIVPCFVSTLLEQPHLDSLRKYTYGKHIVNKAEAMMAAQAAEEQGASATAASSGAEAEAPAPPMATPLPLPK
jgi:pumilio RNA-binding family